MGINKIFPLLFKTQHMTISFQQQNVVFKSHQYAKYRVISISIGR
jgi:hypothetical protein